MIVLALIGLLATPPPETLTRVPGMRFRLGMPESAVLALGSFPEVKAPDAGDMTARQGVARFFGVPGEATCYLSAGRLDHVRFEADSVSRHSQAYVDGQLRRMRFERRCERDEPGDRACAWIGPRVRVSTEMKKDRLVARIEPWPPAVAAAPESLRAGRGTAPPAGASPTRSAAAQPSTPAPAPPPRHDAPPATATPTAPSASSSPSPPRPPLAAARPDTAARRPAAVITLPETLTISLASRNSPDLWPRIVSSPPLHYPEEARRESVQGVVWVMALVDPAGRVLDAWVERGLPELDTAALSWVSRSRFAPCERSGAPCRFHVRVAVLFTLH